MSQNEKQPDSTDTEGIELKIDRLNLRILDIMNNTVFSCRDSDIFSPELDATGRKTLDGFDYCIRDKALIYEE
jgi:hypothetical protein